MNPRTAKDVYPPSRAIWGKHDAAPEPTGSFSWIARCSCGWTGEPQMDRRFCTADIVEHLLGDES